MYITLATGRRIRGRIGDVTSAALTLRDGEARQEYHEAEIARIERRDPIGSGVVLGLLVAMLTNSAIGGAGAIEVVYHIFLPSLAAGATIGGFVDSRHNEILYESTGAGVSVAPTVDIGNRGAGVRMSVGW